MKQGICFFYVHKGAFLLFRENVLCLIYKSYIWRIDIKSASNMKKTKIRAEKREAKKKTKMLVSGKSVFKLKEIIIKKAKKPNTQK